MPKRDRQPRMRRDDRRRLEAFVRARTDEVRDPMLRNAHQALLALVDRLRHEAAREADWQWVEALAIDVFGDEGDLVDGALFGDDPERQADAVGTAILLALAVAHAGHPEYESRWRPRVDDRR